MMLQVDPSALQATAGPLREVADVSRGVDAGRAEMTAQLARAGSEPVRRSTESFLDAWSTSLRGVSDRVESLAAKLHTAASAYEDAERTLRGRLGSGADGGAA
jgi:hypothetical protein